MLLGLRFIKTDPGKLGVGEHAERHLSSGRHSMTTRQVVPHNSEVIEDNMGKVRAASAISDRPDTGAVVSRRSFTFT